METIHINTGKSSTINLPSLAMAGYVWNFEVEGKEIISVSEDRSTSLSENLKAGESMAEKFIVQALQPGTAKIVFSQKRSWEQNNTALSIHIFTVIVS
ncbi:MAG: protease inhibitor I42 family protein [Mucilaginibacter sp.]|uniref:protease inhibitor I42 family protein n=1 Tax=Mucilaginibacter sp. TaxID=1882438 RepID=UPI0034E3EEDC